MKIGSFVPNMYLLAIAALIVGARFALGALGGREDTAFLAGNHVSLAEAAIGAAYVAAHLAMVAVAPIFVIAALIDSKRA